MLHNIPTLRTDVYNYGTFNRGKTIASGPEHRCDYWRGCNRIQETNRYYYLLITGTANYSDSTYFSHYVYRIAKSVLAGQNLQELADNLDSFEAAEPCPARGGATAGPMELTFATSY